MGCIGFRDGFSKVQLNIHLALERFRGLFGVSGFRVLGFGGSGFRVTWLYSGGFREVCSEVDKGFVGVCKGFIGFSPGFRGALLGV